MWYVQRIEKFTIVSQRLDGLLGGAGSIVTILKTYLTIPCKKNRTRVIVTPITALTFCDMH